MAQRGHGRGGVSGAAGVPVPLADRPLDVPVREGRRLGEGVRHRARRGEQPRPIQLVVTIQVVDAALPLELGLRRFDLGQGDPGSASAFLQCRRRRRAAPVRERSAAGSGDEAQRAECLGDMEARAAGG